jgi:DNA polymerase-1
LQNSPTNDSFGVASVFTSRFGELGTLLEVDFKQVEILALAILSNDKVLMSDIRAGRDIHTETGKSVFGPTMTKEQRRTVKTINFGLIYGGGYKTLAQQAGVPESLAKDLVKAFYDRYGGVKEYFTKFYEEITDAVDLYGQPTGKVLEGGFPQKSYVWTSSTGRRYSFRTYLNERSKRPEPSYTESRNYPIQGFATADLVLTALSDVYRRILPRYAGDVLLIGLVHDSLRFDMKVDRLEEFMVELKGVLENCGNSLNKAIRKDLWNLPVKVTFSKGTDFFNMAELA